MDAISEYFAQRASRVERPGDRASVETSITPVRDDAVPGQGFRVLYRSEGIEVHHVDDVGLAAGLDVVELLNDDPTFTSALEVSDAPVLPTRAYLMDLSGDRIPAWDVMVRLVDLLGRLRYNQLELRVGHAYAYRDQDEAWEGSSPMTAVQVRRIASLCGDRGIRLVMTVEPLTHRERWLEHATYRWRAENPDGTVDGKRRMAPREFAVTRDNLAFCTELLREVIGASRSASVNIGGHRTRELGSGQSRDIVARKGVERTHFDFLMSLHRTAEDRGVEHTEMWADVLQDQPELLDVLPDDVIPVVRHSHAPDADDPGYARAGAVLAASGRTFWVAPGTSTWNTFCGRPSHARANIVDALEWGAVNGASGMLLTAWAGRGHWAPETLAFPLVVDAAVQAWSGRPAGAELDDMLRVLLPDDIVDALGELGRVPDIAPVPVRDSDISWEMLARGGRLPAEWGVDAARVSDLRAVVRQARRALSPDESVRGAIVRRQVRLCLDMVDFGLDMVEADLHSGDVDIDGLTGKWAELTARQRRTWLLTSREGGLKHSLAQLDPVGRLRGASGADL